MSNHRRSGPLSHTNDTLCRHCAARDHILGTERRPARGRCRALRHFHETGTRADVRVPQRYRYSADLAEHVGLEGYNDKSELEWLKDFTKSRVDDFDAFMEEGVARFPAPEDAVAFAKQIAIRRTTSSPPSGKIEIYSTDLGEIDPSISEISAIPKWVPHIETSDDYPLSMLSSKSRARAFNSRQSGEAEPGRS